MEILTGSSAADLVVTDGCLMLSVQIVEMNARYRLNPTVTNRCIAVTVLHRWAEATTVYQEITAMTGRDLKTGIITNRKITSSLKC